MQLLSPLYASLAPLPRSHRVPPLLLAWTLSKGHISFSSGSFVPLSATNEAALKYTDTALEEGSTNQNFARQEKNEKDCSSKWSDLPDFSQAARLQLSVYMQ